MTTTPEVEVPSPTVPVVSPTSSGSPTTTPPASTTPSTLKKLWDDKRVKWALAIVTIVVILFLLYRMNPKAVPPITPALAYHAVPAASKPPTLPTIRLVKTPYGELTGDVTADTTTIFPHGAVVSIYSPFNKMYLTLSHKDQAVTSPNVVALSSTVLECTSKDPLKDTKAQWIVKPPNKNEKSVRLNNVGSDDLYIREVVNKDDGKTVFQPGLGIEWSDMWATTVNFLDPSDPVLGRIQQTYLF